MSLINKKGQGLPLNTVVIAILVILVMVVVIVYFTGGMSSTGKDLEKNADSINACEVGSYVIPEDKYSDADSYAKGTDCTEIDRVRILTAKTGDENKPVCCAKKKTDSSSLDNDEKDEK